jgi:membrane protease YdiL (CAAX protease family)
VVASAALFGLWHVLPSLRLNDTNRAVAGRLGGRSGQVSAVLGSVATTFAAGLVFSWLRDRSGSLAAPIVTHAAVNGAGHVAAWRVSSSNDPRAGRPEGEEP